MIYKHTYKYIFVTIFVIRYIGKLMAYILKIGAIYHNLKPNNILELTLPKF